MKLNLTPTEQRLFDLLEDGKPHKPEVLLPLIDELADRNTLYVHLCRLRAKLRPHDEEIVAQSLGKGGIAYRRMKVITTLDGHRKPLA